MYALYNFLLVLGTCLAFPAILAGLTFSRVWRTRLKDRLGFPPKAVRENLQTLPHPRVWFHASSVGELSAVAPIVRALKARHPPTCVLVSTQTLTGLAQVREKIPESAQALLLPLDYRRATRRILRWVEPDLLVLTETELWPNLIREARIRRVPLALINGRISDKSFPRYWKIRRLLRRMLDAFDLIVAQSEKDGERLQALGANPQRMKILGNVKGDLEPRWETPALRTELRLPEERPVWVAGSSRPGEEEIILEAFARVRSRLPQAVLILAPRHLERLREVELLLQRRRLAYTRRSKVSQELIDFPIILLDTMGELARVYPLAQAALVGGSLLAFGGHNPLEPALAGVPVLMGPHTGNVATLLKALVEGGGAKVVNNAEELGQAVIKWLEQPALARRAGEAARRIAQAQRGSAGKTVDWLQKLLLIKNWAREVRNWRAESVKRNSQYAVARERPPENWPEV